MAETNKDDVYHVPLPLFKILSFWGAGGKGMAYLGAVRELYKRHIIQNEVKIIGGISAGLIMSLPIAMGFSKEEITKIAYDTDFDSFKDPNAKTFWSKLGLASIEIICSLLRKNPGMYTGETISAWAKWIVYVGLGDPNATFKDLEKAQKNNPALKGLYTIAYNINEAKLQKFSVVHTPDVPIWQALRATMSIPFVFKPMLIKVNGKEALFVDGGIIQNNPQPIFNNDRFKDPEYNLNKGNANPTCLGFVAEQNPVFVEVINEFINKNEENINKVMSKLNIELTLFGKIKKILKSNDVRDEYELNHKYDEFTMRADALGRSTLDFTFTKEQLDKLNKKNSEIAREYLNKYYGKKYYKVQDEDEVSNRIELKKKVSKEKIDKLYKKLIVDYILLLEKTQIEINKINASIESIIDVSKINKTNLYLILNKKTKLQSKRTYLDKKSAKLQDINKNVTLKKSYYKLISEITIKENTETNWKKFLIGELHSLNSHFKITQAQDILEAFNKKEDSNEQEVKRVKELISKLSTADSIKIENAILIQIKELKDKYDSLKHFNVKNKQRDLTGFKNDSQLDLDFISGQIIYLEHLYYKIKSYKDRLKDTRVYKFKDRTRYKPPTDNEVANLVNIARIIKEAEQKLIDKESKKRQSRLNLLKLDSNNTASKMLISLFKKNSDEKTNKQNLEILKLHANIKPYSLYKAVLIGTNIAGTDNLLTLAASSGNSAAIKIMYDLEKKYSIKQMVIQEYKLINTPDKRDGCKMQKIINEAIKVIGNKAVVTTRNGLGETVFYASALVGDISTTTMLLYDKKLNINDCGPYDSSAILDAAKYGFFEIVKNILKAHVDKKLQNPLELKKVNSNNSSLFHYITWANNKIAAEIFLNIINKNYRGGYKEYTDIKDTDGNSPLHLICKKGHKDMWDLIKKLCEGWGGSGYWRMRDVFDLEAKNNESETPYDIAINNEYFALATAIRNEIKSYKKEDKKVKCFEKHMLLHN